MTKGRARQFDYETALERAEATFREKGYGGAAVTELMAVMGIGAGSFYGAFGSKLDLCEEVMCRYAKHGLKIVRQALAHDSPERALSQLVQDMNTLFYTPAKRPGCLFMLLGGCQEPVVLMQWRTYRTDIRSEIERYLFRVGLPLKTRAKLSSQVMSIIDVLAVEAMTGLEPGGRIPLVEHALDAWQAECNKLNRPQACKDSLYACAGPQI